MAARATGSGVISFGLVSIPVKFYSTVDTTKAIRFNMLRKDGSRLQQQYIAVADGKLVAREERVKGYEFAKDQYVLFTDEEMKAMEMKANNEIAITEFIPAEQVTPIFVEKVNYLGPDKGAARAYHLLAAAMRKSGRSALAKYAARGKSYLVLIQPTTEGLIMVQLRHLEELRSFEDVEVPPAEVKEEELTLALQLIDQVSSDSFEPAKYTDEVRHHMLEMIDRKVSGKEIVQVQVEDVETKIIDLMDALKSSIQNRQESQPKAKRAPKRAPRKAARKRAAKSRA